MSAPGREMFGYPVPDVDLPGISMRGCRVVSDEEMAKLIEWMANQAHFEAEMDSD